MENLGIKELLGPTVIIASFLLSHNDPRGEHPNIDLTARNTAVWLTTPVTIKDELYDFIIGPDGIASSIAIKRSNGQTKMYFQKNDKMIEIEDVKKSEAATFSNLPEGANAQVIYKRYPEEGLRECYTVLTVSGGFSPFAKKTILISGMKNRGLSSLSTSFWAVRITDRTDIPFGRVLTRKK